MRGITDTVDQLDWRKRVYDSADRAIFRAGVLEQDVDWSTLTKDLNDRSSALDAALT